MSSSLDQSSGGRDHPPPPAGSGRPAGRFTPVRVLAGFWEKAGAWALPTDDQGGGYGQVARYHGPQVGFCLLFVFASSWGQTFLLSVFQPAWMATLGLGPGAMGALYGGATLASGLALSLAGRWLDHTPARRLGTVTLLGLAASSLLVAGMTHPAMLAVALFGLRFFGQGLSSNVGMTYAARWFSHNRGKAISLAGLGYPLGELILPGLVTLAILVWGWRWTWVVLALLCLFGLLPLARALVARHPAADSDHEARAQAAAGREGSRRRLLHDWRFYAMLGMIWPLPFVGTGVIFFQGWIAAERGWSAAVFPTGFMIFAVLRALCSLSVGAWVDRLGAVRLLPVPALTFALGLTCLLRPDPVWAYAFFAGMGVSFGAAGAVTTAAWTELFGAARIGTIRAMSSAFAVFVTAAAPVAFGLALGRGWPVEGLVLACAVLLLGTTWPLSWWVRWSLTRRS